jgi:hypothetical protein
MSERLHVELREDIDWNAAASTITSWNYGGYQRANMRTMFLSTIANGTIVLTRQSQQRLFRQMRTVVAGVARMRFDDPRTDVVHI